MWKVFINRAAAQQRLRRESVLHGSRSRSRAARGGCERGLPKPKTHYHPSTVPLPDTVCSSLLHALKMSRADTLKMNEQTLLQARKTLREQ